MLANRAIDSLVNVLQRDEELDSKPINTHFVVTFDSLYLIAILSLSAILLTACASSRVRRFSTWYMFLSTWIVDAISKTLLVGYQTSPKPPPFGLCIVQASLINATPVLCCFYAVTFILQTFFTVMTVISSDIAVSKSHMRWLHAMPCTAFIAFFALGLTFGLTNQITVQKSPLGVYCHFVKPLSKEIMAGFIIFLMTTLLILEAYLALTFNRVWKETGRFVPGGYKEYFSLDAFVRILLISLAPLAALILACFQFLSQKHEETGRLILMQSAFPFIAAILLGSRKDIVCVWIFWGKNRHLSQQIE